MLPVGPAEASCRRGQGPPPLALRLLDWFCCQKLGCVSTDAREREMETEFVEEIDKSSFIFANPKGNAQQASASRTVPPLLGIGRGFISS